MSAAIAGTPLRACHRPCPNVASSLTESSKERNVSHVFAAHTSGEKLSNFAASRQNSEAKSINNGICFFCSIFKFSPDRGCRNLNRFIVLQSHRTILLYDSVEATRSSFRRHIRPAQRNNGTIQPCTSDKVCRGIILLSFFGTLRGLQKHFSPVHSNLPSVSHRLRSDLHVPSSKYFR